MILENLQMRKISDFFPVLNSRCKNGLFEPLKDLPIDAWQNKNRHAWTEEEIEAICDEKDRVFVKNIRLGDREILLLNFNRENIKSKIAYHEKYPNATIYLGKIVQMGKEAFTHRYFKFGSTGTFNDWVSYNPIDGRPKRSRKTNFTIIKDIHLSGLARDPEEFNYI